MSDLRKQKKSVAVAASTGLAAMQFRDIGGVTLHKWCCLRAMQATPEQILERIRASDPEGMERIKGTDVLIIDEIGMVSVAVFEAAEYICRKIKGNDNSFGGIQVICVGDFSQLPPVPDVKARDNGEFCFTSDVFKSCMNHTVYFNTIVRQHEQALAMAVDELLAGRPSKDTEQLMMSLSRPIHRDDSELAPVVLLGTKLGVELLNVDHLVRYSEANGKPIHQYNSTDTGLYL